MDKKDIKILVKAAKELLSSGSQVAEKNNIREEENQVLAITVLGDLVIRLQALEKALEPFQDILLELERESEEGDVPNGRGGSQNAEDRDYEAEAEAIFEGYDIEGYDIIGASDWTFSGMEWKRKIMIQERNHTISHDADFFVCFDEEGGHIARHIVWE